MMVKPELVQYVRRYLAQHVPLNYIKQKLRAAGHSEDDIAMALNAAMSPIRPIMHTMPMAAPLEPPKPEKKGFQINSEQIVLYSIIFIVILVIIFGVFWFVTRPVCGNGKLEKGETSDTCCQDAGCDGEQECKGSRCVDPTCKECEYLEDHRCKPYQCCKDEQCSGSQTCVSNNCQELQCTGCQYASEHKCAPAACCEDSDCNDNNESTLDKCEMPKSSQSICSRLSHQCLTDTDCDDGKASTKDICSGEPRTCSHSLITSCISGDGYCPGQCSYTNDTDCQIPILNCGTNWNCLINATETCTKTNFSHTADFTLNGILYDEYVLYYELQGMLSSRCLFFVRLDSVEIDFTDNLTNQLKSSGASSDEVYDLIDSINSYFDDMEGETGRCAFTKNKLKSKLNLWKTDNFTGIITCNVTDKTSFVCNNTLEYEDGNCEGPLFSTESNETSGWNYSDNIWLEVYISEDSLRRYEPFESFLRVYYNHTSLDGVLVFNLTPFGGIGEPFRITRNYSSAVSQVEYEFKPFIRWGDTYAQASCFDNESDYRLSLYYFNCSDILQEESSCNNFDIEAFAEGDYDIRPTAWTTKKIKVKDSGPTYGKFEDDCNGNEQCIWDKFVYEGCKPQRIE